MVDSPGVHALQPSELDRGTSSFRDTFDRSSMSISGSAFVSWTVHFAHDLVLSSAGIGCGEGDWREASEDPATGGENILQPSLTSPCCGRSEALEGAETATFSWLKVSMVRISGVKEYCDGRFR